MPMPPLDANGVANDLSTVNRLPLLIVEALPTEKEVHMNTQLVAGLTVGWSITHPLASPK